MPRTLSSYAYTAFRSVCSARQQTSMAEVQITCPHCEHARQKDSVGGAAALLAMRAAAAAWREN